MTTITIDRATVEQALEALEHVVRQAQENLVPTIHYGPVNGVMNNLRAALAQQAEPTGKESLQVESVVAENATAQQQIEQTPPSEYRRGYWDGYWDGFNIGKREGRIEAEDELAQQAEPLTIERLRDALVASRIIQPAAVEDPEEYDDGVTLHRIEALHRRIT